MPSSIAAGVEEVAGEDGVALASETESVTVALPAQFAMGVSKEIVIATIIAIIALTATGMISKAAEEVITVEAELLPTEVMGTVHPSGKMLKVGKSLKVAEDVAEAVVELVVMVAVTVVVLEML